MVPIHVGAISIAHPAIDLREINTWCRHLLASCEREKRKHSTVRSRLSTYVLSTNDNSHPTTPSKPCHCGGPIETQKLCKSVTAPRNLIMQLEIAMLLIVQSDDGTGTAYAPSLSTPIMPWRMYTSRCPVEASRPGHQGTCNIITLHQPLICCSWDCCRWLNLEHVKAMPTLKQLLLHFHGSSAHYWI